MGMLLGVIALFAVLAGGVAVVQAIAMVRVAPASERLASYLPLGWWKFPQLEAKVGPAGLPHLTIYKRAVSVSVVFVIVGLILSGLASNSKAPDAQAASRLFNEQQTVTAMFAPIDQSRVATAPGTTFLES